MASTLDNKAAWHTAANAKPLVVGPGPDQTSPADDEVVIKVAYVAINPSEWKMQDFNYLPLKYPHVLGSDVAGTVVKIGLGVTRFKVGDRVMGHCLGLLYGGVKHGGFQTYTTLREVMISVIPDSFSYAQAAVLPLGISTSIVGLFEHLKLDEPVLNPTPNGKTVLIWGGSSSMGSVAIQLATAAGYEVITTASIHNHAYVKALGAQEVFDHTSPDVVDMILQRLSSVDFAGAYDCIGDEKTTRACATIMAQHGGGILPTVLWPPNDLPDNVQAFTVNAANPGLIPGHVGAATWKDYVPAALKAGKLQAKPDPFVIPGGLEKIQEAMDFQKRGVSAQKIVVEI